MSLCKPCCKGCTPLRPPGAPLPAAGQVAEQDPKNRELMASQENALQQLVLMALNDNPIVVEQTCATLRESAGAGAGWGPFLEVRSGCCTPPGQCLLGRFASVLAEWFPSHPTPTTPAPPRPTARFPPVPPGLLAEHSPALAEQVVDNDVESVMDLLNADEESVQLSALHVLAAAAYQSPVGLKRGMW